MILNLDLNFYMFVFTIVVGRLVANTISYMNKYIHVLWLVDESVYGEIYFTDYIINLYI